MTPEERRSNIIAGMKTHGITSFKLIRYSGYAGVRGYVEGQTEASDKNVYAMEQGIEAIKAEGKESAK